MHQVGYFHLSDLATATNWTKKLNTPRAGIEIVVKKKPNKIIDLSSKPKCRLHPNLLVDKGIESARKNKTLSSFFRNCPRDTQVTYFNDQSACRTSAMFNQAYKGNNKMKGLVKLIKSHDFDNGKHPNFAF